MYKITPSGIQREDGAFIPSDRENLDYVAYLEWVDEGNAPTPLEPEAPAIPQTVTRYQARAALLEAGLLSTVESYFAALPDSSLAKLAWREAPTVSRESDALRGAAAAMRLTETQLDSLFLRAAQFV